MGREDLLDRMRAAVAARVAHGSAELRAMSAPALLGALAASALVPVLAASGGAAVLAASVGVVGAVGGNILTDLIKGAVGRLNVPAETGEEPPEIVVRRVAERIEIAFTGGDTDDSDLRREVVSLVDAVDLAGTALRAAAAGHPDLVPVLAAGFLRFGATMGEFAFLLGSVRLSLESVDRQLRQEAGRRSTDRELARRTEAGVRQLLDRVRELSPARLPPPGPRWDGCPYRGLLPFERADSEVFFGRREVISRLLGRLADHLSAGAGLVLVIGPSGAGKSSVLRAGLLAALADDRLVPGCRDWPARVITPTGDPLQSLATTLAALAGIDAVTVHERLTTHPERAHLIAGQILTTTPGAEPARLVLVVDQFEELFTLGDDPSRRAAFVTALHAMAGEPVGPGGRPAAIVIAGIRGDFLDQATVLPPLRAAVEAGPFAVGAMSESDLREVITGPAARAGVPVTSDLVAAVLDDLRDRNRPGGYDSGVLPLLSQVLFEMWQADPAHRLTVGAYRDTGGVATVVRTSAERVYDSLSPAQRDIAWRMFVHLADAGDDGRLTRRPAARAAVHIAVGGDTRDLDVVLEAFTARRLITRSGDDVVEIAHEELLNSWTRLRDWLQPSATDRALRHALADDVNDWRQRRRDPSYLYRGGKLLAVEEAADRWSRDPNPLLAMDVTAEQFLRASNRRDRRRRRVRHAVTAATALLLILTAASAVIAARSADRAGQNAARADHQHRLALSRQFAALSRATTNDRAVAERLAAAALSVSDTAEARNAAGMLLADHAGVLPGQMGAVAFSPDGKLLVTAFLGSIRLWDPVTGRTRGSLPGEPGFALRMRFSPDGKLLATGDELGQVRLWDVATRQPVGPPLAGHSGSLEGLRFSPDGKLLAAAGEDGKVRLWDPVSRRPLATLKTGDTTSLESVLMFSPDGKFLATSGDGTAVQLWDPVTGRPVRRLPIDGEGSFRTAKFSPDGNLIATLSRSENATLRIWDVATGRPVWTVNGPEVGSLSSIAFSPDGRLLAAGSEDTGTVRLWNPSTGRAAGPPLGTNADNVSAVAFSPDGRQLATAAGTGTVQLWDPRTGRTVGSPMTGHRDTVLGLVFSPDGTRLASAGGIEDNSVRLWDTSTSRPAGAALSARTPVWGATFSPDGKLLITCGDGAIRRWDAVTGRPIGPPLPGNPDGATPVAFRSDGKLLAIGTDAGVVQLWDPRTGRLLGSLPGQVRYISELSFGSGGERLAVLGNEGRMQLWNMTTRRPVPMEPRASTMSFSPDGALLASGSDDGSVRLWDPVTGKPRGQPLTGFGQSVDGIAFSPDGAVVTAVGNGPARLWNSSTGLAAGTLETGDDDPVRSVQFGSDGKTLITTNGSGKLQLWDAATRKPIGPPDTGPDSSVSAMALSPDGETFAIVSGRAGSVTLRESLDGRLSGAPLLTGVRMGQVTFSPDGSVLATITDEGEAQLFDVAALRQPMRALCDRVGSLHEQEWQLYAPEEKFVRVCG